MGAPRSARTARSSRSRRLTGQELATLATYEHHFAETDPELVARFDLLWSLAASAPAQRPCAWGRVAPASRAREADQRDPPAHRPIHVLQAAVMAAVAFAALALVVLLGTHTAAAIMSNAGRGVG